jgi:hypothetical protein
MLRQSRSKTTDGGGSDGKTANSTQLEVIAVINHARTKENILNTIFQILPSISGEAQGEQYLSR